MGEPKGSLFFRRTARTQTRSGWAGVFVTVAGERVGQGVGVGDGAYRIFAPISCRLGMGDAGTIFCEPLRTTSLTSECRWRPII